MKFVDNIMKNKKLLSNNPLLYGTAIISFLNILGFIQIGKMNIVLLYIIIAILLSVYTKNMVVVLGAPLLIANLISYMGYNIEGMEERKEEDEEEDDLDANLKELNEKMGELSNLASGIGEEEGEGEGEEEEGEEEEEGDEEYEDEESMEEEI